MAKKTLTQSEEEISKVPGADPLASNSFTSQSNTSMPLESMPQFSCKMDVPPLPGLDKEILTVGREFYLVCDGIFPKDLKYEKLQFKLLNSAGIEEQTGSEKFKLKLLNFELRSASSADLKVVSYLTGSQQISKLVLTDGQKNLDLGPHQFAVHSVLKQGEKNEGYGPIGPLEVPIPLLYWLGFFVILLICVLALIWKIIKVRSKQKLLIELQKFEVPQTPVQQFYQGVRKLRRTYSFFDGGAVLNDKIRDSDIEAMLEASGRLREIFYLYLLRRFKIPALRWNPGQIIKNLRSTHKSLFFQKGSELIKLLIELDTLAQKKEKLKSLDLKQLTELSQKMVDELEEILK